MRIIDHSLILSATDLVGYLNCRHLTALDIGVAEGSILKPKRWDPLLEILQERGRRHELGFVKQLTAQGIPIEIIDGVDITPINISATREAMAVGKEIIIQGAFQKGQWSGRADVLRRVEKSSALGAWSYEIIDTKLARETKGGTVLQLCLYADLLEQAQGIAPENVYVVAPWSNYEPMQFRYADYAAYFRKAKAAIEASVSAEFMPATYPDRNIHCDICRWLHQCDKRRRDDDHLCLVAGLSTNQLSELMARGINTVAGLAAMPTPLTWKPDRGAAQSYERVREQARIQIESREAGELRFELLPPVLETGLCLLPEPSDGDIFFDIEGDPYVGEHGLEYLFGYRYRDTGGNWVYTGDWAFDRENEKAIFERFVNFVTERGKINPELHVYHYAPYEPGTLKRLMGRYASSEDEIDNFLRAKIFVDLYSVVRNGLRAGVESYSIKKLEPLYGFKRSTLLSDANVALASVQSGLELGDAASISNDDRQTVQGYNEDDCASTQHLRDWLEERRAALVSAGTEIPRPAPGQEEPSEELSERQKQIAELVERLTADIPVDQGERTNEQQARWILAYLLDWHRREEKAVWWEYFRLAGLTAPELIDERAALANLTLIGTVDQTKMGIPTHRYRFTQQDTDLRGDEELRAAGGGKIGTAVAVDTENRTIDIKKSKATAESHPDAVFLHKLIPGNEQAGSLFRLGKYVAEHGIEGDGDYRAARALLLNEPPQIGGQPVRAVGEDSTSSALRVASALEGGVFPIQGPPGTGKSFTGARMICRLVQEGKKVGITANSHRVIRNLLNKVIEAAEEMNVDLYCVQKPGEMEPNQDRLAFAKSNDDLFKALASGRAQVAGATHFLWARDDATSTLDVLVVDEAAQMSLANVTAVAPAARTLILLGDPQQLDQPTQGSHPYGTEVSSLEHVLAGDHTIAPDRGIFLETTYRLHPDICAFNSELFYDGKLAAREGCLEQTIKSNGPISGSGLRYLPVSHTGNKSASIEEAEVIASLVHDILTSGPRWVDREGNEKPLTLNDIVIITPYNAQVFEIRERLPGAFVGTVDKFQGQEAPIAIYSMATSSYTDAPRGMEFLYSANRLNVAISRAQCLAILVASPQVFEAVCKTPRQIQLINAFCRFLEVAKPVNS